MSENSTRSPPGIAVRLVVAVLLAGVLLLALEGAAPIVLPFVRWAWSTPAFALYRDPYTGRSVIHDQLRSRYVEERYSPNSLAHFYYANRDWESPAGLYTDAYGFIHNGERDRDLGSSGNRVAL